MMPLALFALQPDYRRTMAEIAAYFDGEPPRLMTARQRLAVLAVLVDAHEDEAPWSTGFSPDHASLDVYEQAGGGDGIRTHGTPLQCTTV